MSKVLAYLECGCAILTNGAITRCPTHDAEYERFLGRKVDSNPTQEELKQSYE